MPRTKDQFVSPLKENISGLENILLSKHMNKVSITAVVNFVENGGLEPHPMITNWKSIHTKGLRRLRQISEEGSDSEISPVQRTEALLRGLSLVLEHHNASEKVVLELNIQVHKYLDSSSDEMVWLKRCKFLLCYPLARYLRNLLPKKPDIAFTPTGVLRGWMKARLNAFNFSNTHLWYSWFQSKRSTLPLSKKVVANAYKEHLATLSKDDPVSISADPHSINQDRLDKIFDDPVFKKVLDQIRTAITKKFVTYQDNHRFSGQYKKIKHLMEQPKTSACYERSRSEGGQLEELRSMVDLCLPQYEKLVQSFPQGCLQDISLLDDQWVEEEYPCIPMEDELVRMDYFPRIFTRKGEKRNYTSSVYGAYGYHEWKTLRDHVKQLRDELCPKIPSTFYSVSEEEESRHRRQFKYQQIEKNLDCTIQAILEPNKIRIISKGNALPYYNCKSLQKVMHGVMKKMPCFRLIGRPLLEGDIFDISRKAQTGDIWSSVDYSAATDGLSYSYSNRILQSILANIPQEELDLAIAVLGPHRLNYPDKEKTQCLQKNGQLMGSILSFPVLCLANLGVYLASTRKVRDLRSFDYEDSINSVLINGDDMVYAMPESCFYRNVKIGNSVGLEMSVGKAYIHREYLNINSQSLLCRLDRLEKRTVRSVNYLNTGLFFGLHKVQEKIEGDLASHHTQQKEGIVPNLNCLLQGALPGKECDLLKKSLTVHKETIKKECQTKTHKGDYHIRNLFIKEVLGGMGINPPSGFKYKVTKNDLYVASGFLDRYPGLHYTTVYPVPGPSPIQMEDYIVEPWAPRSDDPLEEVRVPFREYNFPELRSIVRSPSFSFYIPNEHHRVCTLPNSTPQNLASSVKRSLYVEDRCSVCNEHLVDLSSKSSLSQGRVELFCFNDCDTGNRFIGPIDHSYRTTVQSYQERIIALAKEYDAIKLVQELERKRLSLLKKEEWKSIRDTLSRREKQEFWASKPRITC